MRLEDYTVGQLLGVTHRKIGLGWQHRLKTVGLTPRRYIILRTLWDAGPLCQKDIASHIYADPTSLSRTVRGLLESGLVRRADTGVDRRQVVLQLTPEGRDRVQRGMVVGQQYNASMTVGMAAGEVDTLRALLRRLIDNVQVQVADGGADDED